MESNIAKAIGMKFEPAAILFSNEKPEDTLQNKEGRWSCTIPLMLAAAKGKSSVFERRTTSCNGGIAGLGFGQFPNYPDGIEYFLSYGKEGVFEGEGYKKNPDLGREFVECLPITDIPYTFVIFKPISKIDLNKEKPELIMFYVNTDQLSALTVLANYHRPGIENVIIPQVSGCQSAFLLPYAEAQKQNPKAVVGLTDISVRMMSEPDMLTFTVPYGLFLDMEENVQESFLSKIPWHRVIARMEKANNQ